MLNVDVLLRVGSRAVSEVEKVAVDIQKLLPRLGQWASEALLTVHLVALDLEVALEVEVADSEEDSNNVQVMGAEVVVALVFREAAASGAKMGLELLPQMLQQVRVALVVEDIPVAEEATAAQLAHQIVTVLAVGMIRAEVAHMMTETADIVAINVMDLHVAALVATWSL